MAELSLTEALNLASKAYDQNDLGRCVQLCRAILKAVPNHGGGLYLLGLTLFRQGKHQEGIALVRRARWQGNPNINHLISLANMYRVAGDPKTALSFARAGLAKQPENKGLWQTYAQCLDALGDSEGAEAARRRL